MSFPEFFIAATKIEHGPYDYQIELADSPLCSRVIRVPTGGGKTEAAVLPWLFWTKTKRPGIPRRLILALPMRALVLQTVRRIQSWLDNVGLNEVVLVELLGEDPQLRKNNREWPSEPERPTILVGTVDLLLSAALNRGYAMSRFRWPAAFGLLHNSALWVIDEVQLMGPATTTFAQLEHFRANFGTESPSRTWWMSATVERDWLKTVDFVEPPEITPKDNRSLIRDLGVRYTAKKPLMQLKALTAESLLEAHQGGLTLAVVNTVDRARGLFRELDKEPVGSGKKRKNQGRTARPKMFLIHSRFRPIERSSKMDELIEADRALRPGAESSEKYPDGAIVVATQVAEAGLDISARTMVTEVAPWASMVQRFGRLNRTGEETAAQAIWVDIKEPSPYNQEEIKEARERIKSLKDVSPESLAGVELPEKSKKELVLREHDLIGLYSTDKDLAGGFTDVSEYIRDSEDRNVYIGWRDFEKSPKDPLQGELESWELCPVPISETKPFRPKGHSLWEWNDEATRWERRFAGDIVPGMTLLCSASAGGYSETLGWTGDPSDRPHSTKAQISVNESTQSDPASVLPQWCALDVHLRRVTEEMERICSNLSLENTAREALTLAAKWHDIGKSLPEWQGAAKKAVVKSGGAWMEGIWAKFPAKRGTFRPGLRHEEASALYAAELLRRGDPGWSVLAVFLIACHHGKVRTTLGNYGVKSLRDVPDRRLRLPGMIDEPVEVTCDLLDFHGPGQFDAETGVMSIAGPSWTSLVNELVGSEDGEGKFGPFRLAFFEALIAAADARGSREKEE